MGFLETSDECIIVADEDKAKIKWILLCFDAPKQSQRNRNRKTHSLSSSSSHVAIIDWLLIVCKLRFTWPSSRWASCWHLSFVCPCARANSDFVLTRSHGKRKSCVNNTDMRERRRPLKTGFVCCCFFCVFFSLCLWLDSGSIFDGNVFVFSLFCALRLSVKTMNMWNRKRIESNHFRSREYFGNFLEVVDSIALRHSLVMRTAINERRRCVGSTKEKDLLRHKLTISFRFDRRASFVWRQENNQQLQRSANQRYQRATDDDAMQFKRQK